MIDAMAEPEINNMAHALLARYGDAAAAVAQKNADHVHALGRAEQFAWWDGLILEITRIAAEQPPTSSRHRTRFRGVR
jgi:hypothetical protein